MERSVAAAAGEAVDIAGDVQVARTSIIRSSDDPKIMDLILSY